MFKSSCADINGSTFLKTHLIGILSENVENAVKLIQNLRNNEFFEFSSLKTLDKVKIKYILNK